MKFGYKAFEIVEWLNNYSKHRGYVAEDKYDIKHTKGQMLLISLSIKKSISPTYPEYKKILPHMSKRNIYNLIAIKKHQEIIEKYLTEDERYIALYNQCVMDLKTIEF